MFHVEHGESCGNRVDFFARTHIISNGEERGKILIRQRKRECVIGCKRTSPAQAVPPGAARQKKSMPRRMRCVMAFFHEKRVDSDGLPFSWRTQAVFFFRKEEAKCLMI